MHPATILTDDFVNRDQQLDLFNKVIHGQVEQRLVLLHGPEGIGKSYLLKELRAQCAAAEVRFTQILPDKTQDINNMSITIHLIKELGLGSLEEFLKEISISLAAQTLPEIPLVTSLAVDTNVPGSGAQTINLYGNVITGSAENVTYENILQLIIQDHRAVRERASEVITRYLEKYLCAPGNLRRTVFCLDPWELASADEKTKHWLIETIAGWILSGRIPQAILVIAGASVPDPGFFIRYVCDLSLGSLPDDAIQAYWVEKCHLPIEDLPRVIEGTNGIPLALYLTAKSALFHQQNSEWQGALPMPVPGVPAGRDITGMAVESLLKATPPDLSRMIRLCAVPHWFDQGAFDLLAGNVPDKEALFQQLIHIRFIEEEKSSRYLYGSSVRRHLLSSWWWDKNRLEEYRSVCQSLLKYVQEEEKSVTSSQRGSLAREIIYLQLVTDEARGVRALYESFETFAHSHQFELMEQLFGHAAELSDYLSDSGRLWLRCIEARISWVKKHEPGIADVFKDIQAETDVPELQAVCIHALGNIYLYQHQWSKAAKLFLEALRLANPQANPFVALLIAYSLAETYSDLAATCDGLDLEQQGKDGRWQRLLDLIRDLPFLLFEQVMHRSRWMPLWYFGTNYQDWILTHLRIEASRWYKRAALHSKGLNNPSWTVDIELGRAIIEHQLGRWELAKGSYRSLGTLGLVSSSPYRMALVETGIGQAYSDEGRLNDASALLEKSAPILQVFGNYTQAGNAFARLGLIAEILSRQGTAVAWYHKAMDAFHQANDVVQETQVINRLHSLENSRNQDPPETRTNKPASQYIARFSRTILSWYRRVAMLGAVPVSFFFFFIIAVAAALEINTLEGEIRLAIAGYNTGTALSDAALILAVMILPVPLVLWIYRLLYSMFGLIVVYYQGRRLTRIEKEQPDVITVSDNHIAYETPSAPLDIQELSPEVQSKIQTIPWAQLSTVGFDDYYLFGKIIRLLSRTILVPDSGKQSIEVRAENQPLILEGITTGYWDLQTEISDHVKQSQPQARMMPIKFDFLDLRWFAGIAVASTLIAFYLVSTGQVSCEPYVNTARNLQVYNCIGPFLMNLLPTIALALPAVILWRLLFHSYTVERSFQLRHTTFPTWLRWLSTIFCTLILILWLLIILGQSASPPPA